MLGASSSSSSPRESADAAQRRHERAQLRADAVSILDDFYTWASSRDWDSLLQTEDDVYVAGGCAGTKDKEIKEMKEIPHEMSRQAWLQRGQRVGGLSAYC